MSQYSGWGWANNQWAWDNAPTPITPPTETWGELTLRRLGPGSWVLGGFLSSGYVLGYRTIDSPTADLYEAQIQTPVVGTSWDAQDLANNQVAQLYGGYVLPGSQLDVPGRRRVGGVAVGYGNGLAVPAMQFKVTLNDTTARLRSEGKATDSERTVIQRRPDSRAASSAAQLMRSTASEDPRPATWACDVCDRRFGAAAKHCKVHKRAAGAPPRTPRRGLIQTGLPSRVVRDAPV